MAGKIKVTTGRLREKKAGWVAASALADQDFRQGCEGGIHITDCFDGEVARGFQKEFEEGLEKGKRSFAQLILQIEKLEIIASVYEKAEEENIVVTTEN